jgi:hypothetical protein
MHPNIIAHRGNLNGATVDRENTLGSVEVAAAKGYDSEVDLWVQGDRWWLGHDCPSHRVYLSDLELYREFLWIHCKNAQALTAMLRAEKQFNFFTHQYDPYTLVSTGYIWAFPGSTLFGPKCIAVMPEQTGYTLEELMGCAGICTDYPERYFELRQAHENCNYSGGSLQDLQADYFQFLGSIRTP